MLFRSKDLMVNVLPGHQIRVEGDDEDCACPRTSCAPDTRNGVDPADDEDCGCPRTSCAPDTKPAEDEDCECPRTSCPPDTKNGED